MIYELDPIKARPDQFTFIDQFWSILLALSQVRPNLMAIQLVPQQWSRCRRLDVDLCFSCVHILALLLHPNCIPNNSWHLFHSIGRLDTCHLRKAQVFVRQRTLLGHLRHRSLLAHLRCPHRLPEHRKGRVLDRLLAVISFLQLTSIAHISNANCDGHRSGAATEEPAKEREAFA